MPELDPVPVKEFIEPSSTAIRAGTLGIPGASRVRVTDQTIEITSKIAMWKKELLKAPLAAVVSVRIFSTGFEANCEVTLREREDKYLFTTSEPEKLVAFLREQNVDVNVESLPNQKASSIFRMAEKAWLYVAGIVATLMGLFFLAIGIAWVAAKF